MVINDNTTVPDWKIQDQDWSPNNDINVVKIQCTITKEIHDAASNTILLLIF